MEGQEQPPEVFIPYRKHSSGDLQSRLKTRKILGVGETDNGDIHRSKISQVLGHNDHLYVKFPRYFWSWHFLMAFFYTVTGALNFLLPGVGSSKYSVADCKTNADVRIVMATRFYGCSLFGCAVFLWTIWGKVDKSLARVVMIAVATSEFLQLGVIWNQPAEFSVWYQDSRSLAYLHLLAAAGSLYYVYAIGSSTAGLRKASSYKDLRENGNDAPVGEYQRESHDENAGDPSAKKNE